MLDDRLEPGAGRVTVTRSAPDVWAIEPSTGEPSWEFRLDEGGLPSGSGAVGWPLER